ncbi:arylesterase [Gramella sp. GC03-9]|uniref:Arylesterase n=1 Tax=Christiangramia oceanisediminis TaxID=2920386 RepID=A0A9X2KWT4_9FLAO|nr:arylesterase [Gramella oceanisediminis]MCP9199948.1 arylesterase [Gramella oceanisediminis]
MNTTISRYTGLTFMIFSFLLISCGNSEKKEEAQNPEVSESPETETKEPEKFILFFGNSLTAGLGLDSAESFPAVIQQKIDSLGYNYKVVNAGLSGETTASGKNRIDWVLKQNVDIFVLELGANDGLRGIPLSETRNNLQEIIDFVRQENPDTRIILAGMQIPPNMGPEYTSEFKEIFPELAAKNNLELIPFLLEDVAGRPDLNQDDGIHPTAEGQEIVASNVWEVLGPMLNEHKAAQ